MFVTSDDRPLLAGLSPEPRSGEKGLSVPTIPPFRTSHPLAITYYSRIYKNYVERTLPVQYCGALLRFCAGGKAIEVRGNRALAFFSFFSFFSLSFSLDLQSKAREFYDAKLSPHETSKVKFLLLGKAGENLL